MSELRELLAKATPGPWESGSYRFGEGRITAPSIKSYGWSGDVLYGGTVGNPDIELVVYLRNHAEAIADLIEAAERGVELIPAYPERSPGHMAYLALNAALAKFRVQPEGEER